MFHFSSPKMRKSESPLAFKAKSPLAQDMMWDLYTPTSHFLQGNGLKIGGLQRDPHAATGLTAPTVSDHSTVPAAWHLATWPTGARLSCTIPRTPPPGRTTETRCVWLDVQVPQKRCKQPRSPGAQTGEPRCPSAYVDPGWETSLPPRPLCSPAGPALPSQDAQGSPSSPAQRLERQP